MVRTIKIPWQIPLSLELAGLILLRRKRRNWKDSPLFGAFIGITLSIVPLVLVLEVADGMISGIMNRYIETFYSHIMLRFYGVPDEELLRDLQFRLRGLDGVRLAYQERRGAALLLAQQRRSAVQVRSLEDSAFGQDQGLRQYLKVKSGSLALGPGEILLASDVAFKLQVEPGDTVALLTGANFGGKLRPKLQKFTVGGLVSTGYQELDRLWVFISYPDAANFFHNSTSDWLLHLKIADAFDLSGLYQMTQRVQNLVSPTLARAQSWYSLAAELRQSYQFTKSILVYIMYLIVAVGAINIASSMLLLVLENGPEIAIMKTFGAGKALLRNTYIWVAILVSCMATVLGMLLGLLLSYYSNELIYGANQLLHWGQQLLRSPAQGLDLLDKSYYLEQIPIRLKPAPLALAAALIVLLTLLFSIVPALKAANTLPLEILRQNRR